MSIIGFRKVPEKAPEYLIYVRSLVSAASGLYGVQAHHRIGGRFSQRKVSDFQVMPLTPHEHTKLHAGMEDFVREYGTTEWEMIGKTLYQAVEDGVLVLDKKRALALGAEMQSA
jgi:hypothetical protein